MIRPLAIALVLAVPASAQCLDWSTGFPLAGVHGTWLGSQVAFEAVAHDDGSGAKLYLGGYFEGAGEVSSFGVVRWNGASFEPLPGLGPYAAIGLDVVDLGAGPELYARLGVYGPASLTRWTGALWQTLPSVGGLVRDVCAYDAGGGPELYAAIDVSGSPVHLVRLVGTSWVPVGGGLNGDCQSIAVFDDGGGPALYATGSFTASAAGGVALRGIGRWNGTSWTPVGANLGAFGLDLCTWVDGGVRKLVLGGAFTSVDGLPLQGLAAWDGTLWTSLGGNVTGGVRDVSAVDLPSGPGLAIAGNFTSIGGQPALRAAFYDGASWTSLGEDIGTLSGSPVESIASYDEGSGPSLFVAGDFRTVAGRTAIDVARHDASGWSALGASRGVLGSVLAMEEHDDGGGRKLYLGGALIAAASTSTRQVARFDGTSFENVGGAVPAAGGFVHALESVDWGAGPRLVAAGSFASIDDVPAAAIAAWDGASWAPIGSGLAGGGASGDALLAFDDGAGVALYVGGTFTSAGGVAAANVARFTPSGWSSLGAGPGGPVRALAVFDDGGGPRLYAGGSFPGLVARWSGASWQALPGGPNSGGPIVHALHADPGGPQPLLFAGGHWSKVGAVESYHVAAWDGAAWRAFQGGALGVAEGSVRTFARFDDGTGGGPKLYAGGEFTSIGGVPGASVAAWNGTAWESASNGGVDGIVLALGALQDGEGSSLYAGGNFATTNLAVASCFARYGRHGLPDCEPRTGAGFCDGSGAGAACPCGNDAPVGRGCANSANASGAELVARGQANVEDDTLTLEVAGTTPFATVLFFQGTGAIGGGAGVVFGDGVRCVGGAQIRLAIRVASGGVASFGAGVAGDPGVAEAGAVEHGEQRLYQVWYRDAQPGFCTSSTFNLSNGLSIRW